MKAGIHADAAVELAVRQAQTIGHAVVLEDAVPALDAGRAVADVPVAQHLVHRVAHQHIPGHRPAVLEELHVVDGVLDEVIVEGLLLGAPLEAVGEVRRRVARHLAAVQVEAEAEPLIQMLLDRRQVDAAERPHVLREAGFAHQLAGALENARDAGLADEHVVRFLGQHEPRRARQRIERALRQRHQLRLAVAIGEHREHEEVEPVVDRLVERLEDPRLVAVAALALEQLLGFVAAVAAEVRVQQVDHRPQMTPFLDVHLKQVAQIVQARAALPEPAAAARRWPARCRPASRSAAAADSGTRPALPARPAGRRNRRSRCGDPASDRRGRCPSDTRAASRTRSAPTLRDRR